MTEELLKRVLSGKTERQWYMSLHRLRAMILNENVLKKFPRQADGSILIPKHDADRMTRLYASESGTAYMRLSDKEKKKIKDIFKTSIFDNIKFIVSECEQHLDS